MTYTLTSDKRGYVANRIPWRISKELELEFKGNTDGCRVILTCNGSKLYKEIIDGKSKIPVNFLDGNVEVSVRDLNAPLDRRWDCEGLVVIKTKDITWVYPEGLNLADEIVKMREEIDELKIELLSVKEIAENLVKGYDII